MSCALVYKFARVARTGLLVLVAACGSSAGQAPAQRAPPSPARPVFVTVSVDWEGAYFDEDGLAALTRFRDENPDVPLTHFVCAAYYTKPGAAADEVMHFLRAHVRDGDETALHLHAWRSLIVASGVRFRSGRSFLTPDGKPMEFEDDIGFDLDPSAYTVAELRAIIKKSRELLEAGGFQLIPAFRAGAWIAPPNVLEAVRAEGFVIDSSATDPDWLGEGAGGKGVERLAARVRAVWPKVRSTTQPFLIDTPAGSVLEMPDTGAMADHMTVEEMERHVGWAAHAETRPIFVHLGFHAETAHHFAPLLTRALARLRKNKVPIEFVTLGRAAEAARAAMK
jgi:hypothetical protein